MKKIFVVFFIVGIILIPHKINHKSDYQLEDKSNTKKEISDDYIAVFHGGSGELTHETYVYKTDSGFEYINTESWGMTAKDWKSKKTETGKVETIEDIVKIAEKNSAMGYGTLKNDSKTYDIHKFEEMLKTSF